ncbi:alpha/beta-hydrolase [Penicillium argentinense]|uniref:Alpha/beta-hydrolase n=1 Tax=Penicillium argentinense TaxID=1131581 RepID=A0A9W9FGK8_9EURO|nr:alpha/beta-hydrolase [Penicillium argentinense]KAJ5099798.1 alpha/beta-hydrolase [Penicillium argentinense]
MTGQKLAVPVLNRLSKVFHDGVPSDPYLEPLTASKDCFQDLPVNKALVLAGSDELFVDYVAKFVMMLQIVYPEVVSETVANARRTSDGVHDEDIHG